MKVFVVGNDKENKIGGGWSWLNNFRKGDWEIVEDPKDCDIYLVTAVSMLDKVSQIPFEKKVVLRVDNALLDSRNGRIYGLEGEKITRMEAMRQIAQKADAIVYQSNWAKSYLKPFLGACGGVERVIINGSDDELFNPDLGKLPKENTIYLYVRSSNHDNKGFYIAHYEFEMIHRKDPTAILWIAGRFSPENLKHNFDFFFEENYKYLGYIQDRETMALYMRSADYLLYSYFNDCSSQTLVEAYLSGLKIKWLVGSESGGSPEIRNLINKNGREALSYRRMNQEYKKLMEEL